MTMTQARAPLERRRRPPLEPWREAFRYGLARVLPTAGLEELARRLRRGVGLVHGQTTVPTSWRGVAPTPGTPPVNAAAPLEAGCPVAVGSGAVTVGEACTRFRELTEQAERELHRQLGPRRLPGVLGCLRPDAGDFYHWWDEAATTGGWHLRALCWIELRGEVERELARRREESAAVTPAPAGQAGAAARPPVPAREVLHAQGV